MSNSQNKKNEQQNNLCTTLTEQWKKGELENDWYYIRTTNGVEKWEYIKQSHGFGYYETEWVLEVLAPVPSYEEWKQLHKFLEEFNALDVAKENQQLKELLGKCRTMLGQFEIKNPEPRTYDVVEMLLKIDDAIGGKK